MPLMKFAKVWLICPALILVEGWAMKPVAPIGFVAALSYLAVGVPLGRVLAVRLNLPKGAWVLDVVIVAVTATTSALVALAGLIALQVRAPPARAQPNLWAAAALTLLFAALFTGLAVFLAQLVLKPPPPSDTPAGEQG